MANLCATYVAFFVYCSSSWSRDYSFSQHRLQQQGGDNFVVTITGPKGEHVPSVIKDNDDGTYRVEYAAMNPGPTRVEVTLRGKHVANSPYTVMVGDNWADAMKTRAWGPGLEGAMCGQPYVPLFLPFFLVQRCSSPSCLLFSRHCPL